MSVMETHTGINAHSGCIDNEHCFFFLYIYKPVNNIAIPKYYCESRFRFVFADYIMARLSVLRISV